ncbi:DUF4142 domain-containing protein [Actinomadura sp. BRA 177]|uniref:DUF4142 domain-containing protein n=1 Tax=Actinomadura sp. BRA 177 TaxID=2745202 RepID=UPI001595B458|nr:DUF4142 domain-containing protein [Actinomadura sp. BRA 177]NVI86616.1 DUF4142 domain-containing protein [Actinomadura sp. BRA 177]
MTRSRLLALALAAAAVVAAPAACSTEAHDTRPDRSLPSSPLPGNEQDRTWLKSAHQANLAEISAGQIAQEKGTTTEIRSLGQMITQDHRALDEQLKQLAGRLGVEVPRSPTAQQQLTLDELKSSSGRSFDNQWLIAMAHAHEKAIAATKTEISMGSAEVKALAEKALPVLEKHLARIKVAQGG